MLTSTWLRPNTSAASATGAHQASRSDGRRDGELPPAIFVRRWHAFGLGGNAELRRRLARDQVADRARAAATISGNGSARKKMPTKAARRQREQQRGLERALADADERLDHDHQHGGLDAEQRAVDQRDAAAERVEQAQAQHHEGARQHEQDAGGEPAAHAMQQPADIGRELLRLRARQQHAEIERVQETRLVEPFFLVDHDAVHQRDLPGRAAEIDAADLQPDLEGFAEARRARVDSVVVHAHAALAGQLCRSSAAKRSQANRAS